MKKTLFITASLLTAVLLIPACRQSSAGQKTGEATAEAQIVDILNTNGCTICHSFSPENVPFYASWSRLGMNIREEMHRAARFVTFDPVDSTIASIDEIRIAKIEQAVLSGSMPPASYRHIHWRSRIDPEEKGTILEWIRTTRARKFSDGLACEELSNEPIRPIPSSIPTDEAKVTLGKTLYNDTRISLDGTISCATCHILEEGGADHADERTSEGINGLKGTVNSPTVYNSAFQIRQFWNGRAHDLAAQAAQPPTNPVEMGDQTWEMIVSRLRQDRTLVKEFDTLYPEEGLTESSVCDAIAEYEKTLLTPDSPFDRYLKGDRSALTAEELEGYARFRENDCATCHSGILAGGGSFEYLGIADETYFQNRDAGIAYSSDDDGLKGFTGSDRDLHRFKVPTLRNVALTPPYLHDGTALTLQDAIKVMMTYQTGAEYDDQTAAQIILFLNTLTGINENLTAANQEK